MKLTPQDPRLTAYHLGELDAEEARQVQAAIEADPALQSAIEDLNSTTQKIRSSLEFPDRSLSPKRVQELLNQAQARSLKTSAPRAITHRLAIAACLAAIVAVLVYFWKTSSSDAEGTPTTTMIPVEKKVPAVLMPAPSPLDPNHADGRHSESIVTLPDGRNLPELRTRLPWLAAEASVIQLPISAGRASLPWIQQAVRLERRWPHAAEVRLEEILNTFALQFPAVVAMARIEKPAWHPDQRPVAATQRAAMLSAEMIACPWRPSSVLLFTKLTASPNAACEVALAYHPNTTGIQHIYLLGYDLPMAQNAMTLPTHVPAGGGVVLALEIQRTTPDPNLGQLVWSANGEQAPSITLQYLLDKEPSKDARFAAVVCAFSIWLRQPTHEAIDADLVLAMAREVSELNMPPERADYLLLVQQTIVGTLPAR
ncbi:MAG: hypothetical protein EAZ42_06220 [Verrucomicrobia bacterium]|nr:MAG: hypothetical protein EAZ42_06220 [Verrucomicrobiota bacterium]